MQAADPSGSNAFSNSESSASMAEQSADVTQDGGVMSLEELAGGSQKENASRHSREHVHRKHVQAARKAQEDTKHVMGVDGIAKGNDFVNALEQVYSDYMHNVRMGSKPTSKHVMRPKSAIPASSAASSRLLEKMSGKSHGKVGFAVGHPANVARDRRTRPGSAQPSSKQATVSSRPMSAAKKSKRPSSAMPSTSNSNRQISKKRPASALPASSDSKSKSKLSEQADEVMRAAAEYSSSVSPFFEPTLYRAEDITPSYKPTQFLQRPLSAPPKSGIVAGVSKRGRASSASRPRPASAADSNQQPASSAVRHGSTLQDRPQSSLSTRSTASRASLSSKWSENSSSSSSRPQSALSRASQSSKQRIDDVYTALSRNKANSDIVGVGAEPMDMASRRLAHSQMTALLKTFDIPQGEAKLRLNVPADCPEMMGAAGAGVPQLVLPHEVEEIFVHLEWWGRLPAVTESKKRKMCRMLGEEEAMEIIESAVEEMDMEADLDLSLVLFDNKLTVMDVVFFNNLRSRDGAVLHSGDVRGVSGIAAETAVIRLDECAPSVYSVAICVNNFAGREVHERLSREPVRPATSEGRVESTTASTGEANEDEESEEALKKFKKGEIIAIPRGVRLTVFSRDISVPLAVYNIDFMDEQAASTHGLFPSKRPMSAKPRPSSSTRTAGQSLSSGANGGRNSRRPVARADIDGVPEDGDSDSGVEDIDDEDEDELDDSWADVGATKHMTPAAHTGRSLSGTVLSPVIEGKARTDFDHTSSGQRDAGLNRTVSLTQDDADDEGQAFLAGQGASDKLSTDNTSFATESARMVNLDGALFGCIPFLFHRGHSLSAAAAGEGILTKAKGNWQLQTVGAMSAEFTGPHMVQVARQNMVASGTWIPHLVIVEHCVAPRPSVSLRGKSEQFLRLFKKVQQSIERTIPFAKVVANPPWMFPLGPRIGSFEISVLKPGTSKPHLLFSKADTNRWPRLQEVESKVRKALQGTEKTYPLPVDMTEASISVTHMLTSHPVTNMKLSIVRLGEHYDLDLMKSVLTEEVEDIEIPDTIVNTQAALTADSLIETPLYSGRTDLEGSFACKLPAGIYSIGGKLGGFYSIGARFIVRPLTKDPILLKAVARPIFHALTGRVVHGTTGQPLVHGIIKARMTGGLGSGLKFEVPIQAHHVNSSNSSSDIGPKNKTAAVPVPTLQTGKAKLGTRAPDSESSEQSSNTNDEVSGTASEASSPSRQHGEFTNKMQSAGLYIDPKEAETIDPSHASHFSGTPGSFQLMLPSGDYLLTLEVAGFTAGGDYEICIRRGPLHLGAIMMSPDDDRAFVDEFSRNRSKERSRIDALIAARSDIIMPILEADENRKQKDNKALYQAVHDRRKVLLSKAPMPRNDGIKSMAYISNYCLSIPPSAYYKTKHKCGGGAGGKAMSSSFVLGCHPALNADDISTSDISKHKAAVLARKLLSGKLDPEEPCMCALDGVPVGPLAVPGFSHWEQANNAPAAAGVMALAGSSIAARRGLPSVSMNLPTTAPSQIPALPSATAGITTCLTVEIRDRFGNPIPSSSDVLVTVTARKGVTSVHCFPPDSIGDGLYVVSFTPDMLGWGDHELSVMVKQVHVEGSPLNLCVQPYDCSVAWRSKLPPPAPIPVPIDIKGQPIPAPHMPQPETSWRHGDMNPGVVKEWAAPYGLYNEETLRWAAQYPEVGVVDVVFAVEVGTGNKDMIDAIFNEIGNINHMISQLELLTSVRYGLVAFRRHLSADETNVSSSFPLTKDHGAIARNLRSAFFNDGLQKDERKDMPTSVDDCMRALTEYDWRDNSGRCVFLLSNNGPYGMNHHVIEDLYEDGNPGDLRWSTECEKLRCMGVEVNVIRVQESNPSLMLNMDNLKRLNALPDVYGSASGASSGPSTDPTSKKKALERSSSRAMSMRIQRSASVFGMGLSSLNADEQTSLQAMTIAYHAACDAVFSIIAEQTFGHFVKVDSRQCAMQSFAHLVAVTLDRQLLSRMFVCESVKHRNTLARVPNHTDRKRLLVDCAMRSNVSARAIVMLRDCSGIAGIMPVAVDELSLELVLCRLRNRARQIFVAPCDSQEDVVDRLSSLREMGGADCFAMEFIEFGVFL